MKGYFGRTISNNQRRRWSSQVKFNKQLANNQLGCVALWSSLISVIECLERSWSNLCSLRMQDQNWLDNQLEAEDGIIWRNELFANQLLRFVANNNTKNSCSCQFKTLKRYIINYPYLLIMGGEYFVFLFHQGTEQPHQGDVNNIPSFLIHPRRYAIRTKWSRSTYYLFSSGMKPMKVFTKFIVWS